MLRPDWLPSWAVPGAKCACISDFWQVNSLVGPDKGDVVTICEVYQNAGGYVTLRFREHYGWIDENTGQRHGYNARNFRPLASRGADATLIRALAVAEPETVAEETK